MSFGTIRRAPDCWTAPDQEGSSTGSIGGASGAARMETQLAAAHGRFTIHEVSTVIERVSAGQLQVRVGHASDEPLELDGSPATQRSSNNDGPLERLQRGEMRLADYLETRIGDAVQHLSRWLMPPHLELVRDTLREQLASDPVLQALLRRVARTESGAAL